jgi:hypothetical protein
LNHQGSTIEIVDAVSRCQLPVTFDGHRETTCTENGKGINLTSNPICSNHSAVADLCDAKQSGHCGTGCNPCGGIKCAQHMLTDSSRAGCQKTIVVVSCSTPICEDRTVSVPSGWDWNKEWDYNHDGVADYSTTGFNKACAVVQAKEAAKSGCTVHTIAVGNQCDTALMKAIAHVGCGKAQTVPQSSDPVVMNTNVRSCFQKVSTATPSCKTKCL